MARVHNLTSSIVEELGIAIVTGQYTPENPFPVEASLCQQFEASRSVLREAVKMLTAKGLLSARPRQGTRVEPVESWNLLDPDVLRWLLERKFSLDLLADFAEIRMAVEPMAAFFAAQRADEAAILRIEEALARMEAAQDGTDDPTQSDIAFHISILHASGNQFFVKFEDLVETALKFSIRLTNRFKGVQIGSVAEHGAVLTAIKAGDAEKARAGMEKLVEETLNLINEGKAEDKLRREQ